MPLGESSVRYTCNITKVLPGDILLSRIPMDLENESTWDSHLIQALTRSCYSFAALCVSPGLLIEAVGTGVARLPLWNAGICDSRNVRLLRPRKDYKWAAVEAAARGLSYLERGFYRPGVPKPRCTAFQDVRRAATAPADMVISAYAEAGLALNTEKPSEPLFPGDLVDSRFFEDVTSQLLQHSSLSSRAVFNLDDDTLRKRIHHWEIETQLKVLCKYEVRRILELKSAKPSSLSELETLIAQNQWRSLDSALHHTLQWYRYDRLYQLKQNQLLNNFSSLWSVENPLIDDELFDNDIESGEFKLLEMEAEYCRKQRDRYRGLISLYKASSFYYMHDFFSSHEMRLSGLMNTINDRKYKRVLLGDPIANYIPGKIRKEERFTHKKYYEIN